MFGNDLITGDLYRKKKAEIIFSKQLENPKPKHMYSWWSSTDTDKEFTTEKFHELQEFSVYYAVDKSIQHIDNMLYVPNIFSRKIIKHGMVWDEHTIPVVKIEGRLYHLKFPWDILHKNEISGKVGEDYISAGRYPEFNLELEAKDMKIGEEGYIINWGIWVNHRGRIWLHSSYTVHKNDEWGNAQLKIKRIDEKTFYIDPESEGFRYQKYSPSERSPYCGTATFYSIINNDEIMEKMIFEKKRKSI